MMRFIPALLLLSAPASAEIVATLEPAGDSARLVIANAAACDAGPFEFMLDLRLAAHDLRFARGQGARPFALEEGAGWLAAATDPGSDGKVLTFALADLPAGGRISMTLALEGGRGRPPGDLSGALAAVAFRTERTDAPFGPEGAARLPGYACP